MRRLSTTQKIETSREIRQWIKTVILPGIGLGLAADAMYPDLKYKVKDFCKEKVEGIKARFSKEEKES